MNLVTSLDSKLAVYLAVGGALGALACSGSDKTNTNVKGPDVSNTVALGHCQSASTDACGDFTTPTGTKIQLGPYGAIMEPNVGVGFENTVAAGDADDGTTCKNFAEGFKEDPTLTAQLLDTKDLNFALYTIYRPANWSDGKTFPVITWGNGTCAQPDGYGALLRYVASYGFVIIAANSRWVGGATEMLHGLDFVAAANEDASSPYYHHLDLGHIGAMGHSQGAIGTGNAANDPRVSAVILFNGGASASKPFLAISGEMDITNFTPASMSMAVNAAPEGAFMFFHQVAGMGPLRGHLTLMLQPERVIDAAANWWLTALNGDAAGKKWFVGTDCGLCGKSDQFDFGEHGMD